MTFLSRRTLKWTVIFFGVAAAYELLVSLYEALWLVRNTYGTTFDPWRPWRAQWAMNISAFVNGYGRWSYKTQYRISFAAIVAISGLAGVAIGWLILSVIRLAASLRRRA